MSSSPAKRIAFRFPKNARYGQLEETHPQFVKKLFRVASENYDSLKIGMKQTIKFINQNSEKEMLGGRILVWREYLHHKVYCFRGRGDQTTFLSTWNCLAQTFFLKTEDPVAEPNCSMEGIELVWKVTLARFLEDRLVSSEVEIVTLKFDTSLTRQFVRGFGGLCFVPKEFLGVFF
jgi:hypothetical protein